MSVWQQPTLNDIRDALNPNTNARIIRVGQLDAELLDQELVSLLQEPLNKALALINIALRTRFEPELTLLIQLTLYKLSIWNTGATYGAKLQDLRYVTPLSRRGPLAPSGLPRRMLLLHGTLTVLIPYFHTRLRSHALSQAWPDAPSSDTRRKAWELLTSLESSYTLFGLLSFIAFLWDGRYRTLTDRLLKMSLVPSRRLVKRDVSYEFMNRQMVWHAFTEFLLFLLPLINARSVRRKITSILSQATVPSLLPSSLRSTFGFSGPTNQKQSMHGSKRGKYWSLPQDQCAICAENAAYNLNLSDSTNALSTLAAASSRTSPTSPTPLHETENTENEPPPFPITNPYVTSCGDIYCYHCIAERILRAADDAEGGWECLRCSETVKTSSRFLIEFGSEESDYEFSSDIDLRSTSMSSSITGSYSTMSDN